MGETQIVKFQALHNPILKNSSESLIRRRSRLKKEKELGDIEREGMKKKGKVRGVPWMLVELKRGSVLMSCQTQDSSTIFKGEVRENERCEREDFLAHTHRVTLLFSLF